MPDKISWKGNFCYFLDVATIINSEDNPITSSGQILPLFEFNEHLSVLNRLDKTDYEAKQNQKPFFYEYIQPKY